MKPSEFLAQARDEIEAGWARGTLQDQAGNVCAVGSLRRIAQQNQASTLDGFTEVCAAGNGAATALEMMAKEFGSSSIIGFNDTRRDKQEVLTWFEKTIIGLEERGE